MKDTKELILREAFKLFASNNYEKVTVVDLESATGMSRGAIFYHTKNKAQLFNMVVDRYYFSAQDPEKKFQFDPKVKLIDFIHKYIEGVNKTMNYMRTESLSNMNQLYYGFILQASKYYPDFAEKHKTIMHGERFLWAKRIKYAQEIGEIRSDVSVDNISSLFSFTFKGMAWEQSFLKGLNTLELLDSYLQLYSLIKT